MAYGKTSHLLGYGGTFVAYFRSTKNGDRAISWWYVPGTLNLED